MEFSKLYSTLVLGGALLAGGCATPAGGETTGEAASADVALNCSEICHGDPDSGVFCPDPVQKVENCCWLMVQRHPCCPAK